jgi:hypothetical protein
MQLLNVRTLLNVLVAGAIIGGSTAQAGSVIGGQAFSVGTTTPNASSILSATQFDFKDITTASPNDGDFTSITLGTSAGTGPFTLSLPAGTFSFGNATFGTFTSSALVSDTPSTTTAGNFRNIALSGTFAGGTLFPGKNDPTSAVLLISLTQAGGTGRPASASFTLVTQAVPEPASVVMMGLGLAGALGVGRLRRKMV